MRADVDHYISRPGWPATVGAEHIDTWRPGVQRPGDGLRWCELAGAAALAGAGHKSEGPRRFAFRRTGGWLPALLGGHACELDGQMDGQLQDQSFASADMATQWILTYMWPYYDDDETVDDPKDKEIESTYVAVQLDLFTRCSQ